MFGAAPLPFQAVLLWLLGVDLLSALLWIFTLFVSTRTQFVVCECAHAFMCMSQLCARACARARPREDDQNVQLSHVISVEGVLSLT